MKSKKTKRPNPIPANEEERLKALREYRIMDTLPEKQFDDITRLASLICDTPMTLITLIDEGRQWFKSKLGMQDSETPREFSFCQYTIMGDEIFEVEDSLKDERFAENPLVLEDPNIRFYAGAPIKAPQGQNLGTLCVVDTKPNKLSAVQREALQILANEIVINLELRKEREHLELERKKAFESNELLNAFMEHSPSFFALRDATDGHYLMVNQASIDNLNISREHAMSSSLSDLFPKEVVDKVMLEDSLVVESGEAATFEFILGEGDERRTYLRHLFPVFDADGTIYGVGTIANDITNSKKLEYEFKLSSERFASIFYDSPMCVVITDLITSEFIMVNNTFLNIFGYSKEEVIGALAGEVQLIAQKEERLKFREELMKQGKLTNYEMELVRKSGERFVGLCSVEIVTVDGKKQVISAFQDITERKKMEVKLEEAKKEAEASTLSKSNFLANMSHEIRTPLNAMLGFTGILAGTDLDMKQREYLGAIDTSGKNLLGIINDILDFSKIEAGMFSIESTPFSVQQALHSVNTMFFEKAQAKKLKFFTSIDPRMPSLVNGDPTRFNQIMINLIGNAIKFTNAGQITVECTVQQLSKSEVTALFTVTDTGIGIAQDKLESIFNRFTQAQEDTTRNFGGTGLGLSIAKKLLELQGAELLVESELNLGSTFSFAITYPVSESTEYAHSETNSIEAQNVSDTFQGKKILVVEDNQLNQKLASTILSSEGFEVVVSSNGQLALDLLQGQQVDLILMDIQMPVMDGYQTTKELRERLKVETPIIAMTANALTGERERCISFGMNDYITKPFKTQELLSKIGALLKA